jgi:hypothetical protein
MRPLIFTLGDQIRGFVLYSYRNIQLDLTFKLLLFFTCLPAEFSFENIKSKAKKLIMEAECLRQMADSTEEMLQRHLSK